MNSFGPITRRLTKHKIKNTNFQTGVFYFVICESAGIIFKKLIYDIIYLMHL